MSGVEEQRRGFYADLRAAFLAAGPPTYSHLVEIMRKLQIEDPERRTLGSSALQSMMNGGNRLLPRWAVLSTVIQALRMEAEKSGLDPARVGTVEQWHRRLLEAAEVGPDQGTRSD